MSSSLLGSLIPQHRLRETKPSKKERPIYLRMRKMKGLEGSMIRKLARIIDTKQDAAAETAHLGLEVGPYLWEVVTDSKRQKTLSYQRLAEWQKWTPDVDHQHIGVTTCSDTEIGDLAFQPWKDMRMTGGYHILENNCQHFVQRLYVHIENRDSVEVNRRLIERIMLGMLNLLGMDSDDDEPEKYEDGEENQPWKSGSGYRTNSWW